MDTAFKIIRKPDVATIRQAIKDCDILLCNGPSLRMTLLAMSVGKPVVWTHQNYRVSCVDGLGWLAGKPAPITPFQSCLAHLQARGAKALTGIIGLWLLRLICNFVSANIAISQHMARRQPLPHQTVIYNPFNSALQITEGEAQQQLGRDVYRFGFLGRLVSEKGCDVLINALSICNQTEGVQERFSLLIIGDGPERAHLESLAGKLGVASDITWTGTLCGDELVAYVKKTAIFVLPSVYEEPMGLVALELMAAGKPLIVSAIGGLSECAGDGAVCFPNGDAQSLSEAMKTLSADKERQAVLICHSLKRIAGFNPQNIIDQYLELLGSLN